LESQIILKSLGTGKPKGLNRFVQLEMMVCGMLGVCFPFELIKTEKKCIPRLD
jgi:hypothetical protein